MKSLYHFIEQAEQTPEPKRVSDDIFNVFGRFQPSHEMHGRLWDHASKLAEGIGDKAPADQRFNTSWTQDPKNNPLPHQLKIKWNKRLRPQHADKWDTDPNVRTVLQAATKAGNEGYKNFHFVGGGDRKKPMEDLLRKYNGQLWPEMGIYSHSVGDRILDDSDGDEDTSKMTDKQKEELKRKIFLQKLSAKRMRGWAQSGDIENFAQGLPVGRFGFTMDDAKELFRDVQMFGEKNESWENDKDQIREMYRQGRLFNRGDVVESLATGLVGRVHRCGSNHLICVTEDDIMFKEFIYDVQSI